MSLRCVGMLRDVVVEAAMECRETWRLQSCSWGGGGLFAKSEALTGTKVATSASPDAAPV